MKTREECQSWQGLRTHPIMESCSRQCPLFGLQHNLWVILPCRQQQIPLFLPSLCSPCPGLGIEMKNRQKIGVTTLCYMFFIRRRGKGKEKEEERGGRHCVGPKCVCSFLLCLFSSKHPNKTTGADDSIMQSQETMGGRTTTK